VADRGQEAVSLAGGALGAHRHVGAFFHTRDEEYRTLLPFVQEGFRRGEKAIHIVDPALRADHLARLCAVGIDVAAAQARKQLEVHVWTDTYVPGGVFDWRATAARVSAFQRQAREEGFPRTRVIGHGDWALDDPANLAKVVEYEVRMNDLLPEFDDPAICTYDRSRFGGSTTVDLLRAHPVAILDGALQENPFLVPTSRFLSRLRGDTVPVLRDRFLAALVAGARREALDIVVEEGLWDDVPVRNLYLEVVQPSMYEIGRLWQQKRITVAQEHVATDIARVALAQLRLHLPCAPSNGKHVVVACVEGELHDLGARVTADFLEMAGFEVHFLGANVPTDSLAELVRRRPPDMLALSASATSNIAGLRRAIAAVRGVAGGRVPLAAGGPIFLRRPNLSRQLGVLNGQDALAAVAIARRLMGR
jgi:methanogenic corrinoid protein MtbC1